MHYDHFVGQVQHRARLGSTGDAVGAIRATLETLAERLAGGEAKDLASQLPREIAYYLMRGIPELPQRFGLDEFVWRVSMREGVEMRRAFFHARVVLEVVSEAVSLGEMEDVVSQLPAEFGPLFAGSQGEVRGRRSVQRSNRESYRSHEGAGRRGSRDRELEFQNDTAPATSGRGRGGMGYSQHGAWADETREEDLDDERFARTWSQNERTVEEPGSERAYRGREARTR